MLHVCILGQNALLESPFETGLLKFKKRVKILYTKIEKYGILAPTSTRIKFIRIFQSLVCLTAYVQLIALTVILRRLLSITFAAPDESMAHQSASIIRAMHIAIEKKSEESGKR
jgi:hypothetical protein